MCLHIHQKAGSGISRWKEKGKLSPCFHWLFFLCLDVCVVVFYLWFVITTLLVQHITPVTLRSADVLDKTDHSHHLGNNFQTHSNPFLKPCKFQLNICWPLTFHIPSGLASFPAPHPAAHHLHKVWSVAVPGRNWTFSPLRILTTLPRSIAQNFC